MRIWHRMGAAISALVWAATALAVEVAPSIAPAFTSSWGFDALVLNPDGQRFAAVLRDGAKRGIVVRATEGGPVTALFVSDSPVFDVRGMRWLDAEHLLVNMRYSGGSGFQQSHLPAYVLAVLNVDPSKKPLNLYGAGRIEVTSNRLADEVDQPMAGVLMVAVSTTEHDSTEVMRVNLTNGRARKVQGGRENFQTWWADADGEVRVALRRSGDRKDLMARDPGQSEWRRIGDAKEWVPLGFGADPGRFYVRARQEGEHAVLALRIDQAAVTPELVLRSPRLESVTRLLRDPQTGAALGAASSHESVWWGADLARLQAGLEAALPASKVRLRQWLGDRYLTEVEAMDQPLRFMLGQRSAKRMDLLAQRFPALGEQALPMWIASASIGSGKIRSARTRPLLDDEEALLLRPPGAKAAPLLVCVACGLDDEDKRQAFNPLAAFLVSQGYSLLLALPSDSKESGASPVLLRQIAQERLALTRTLSRLGELGLVDASRYAWIGDNVQGLIGLQLAADAAPGLRAVVALGAVSDLNHYRRSMLAIGSAANQRAIDHLLGSVDDAVLARHSPLEHTGRFEVPVLLIHGELDGVAEADHSRRLAKALKEAGKPVQTLFLPQATQDISQNLQRQQVLETLERWLADHFKPASPAPRTPDAQSAPSRP